MKARDIIGIIADIAFIIFCISFTVAVVHLIRSGFLEAAVQAMN